MADEPHENGRDSDAAGEPPVEVYVLDDLLGGPPAALPEANRPTSGPPIEVIGSTTGNCYRVTIALEEAGVPYIVRRIDLARGYHRSPEHLALNPAGKVPTIVDRSVDGRPFVLSQSNAIMLHIADRVPGRLLPAMDPRRRALVLERFMYFVTDVIAVSHAAFASKTNGHNATFLESRSLAALEFAEGFLSDARFVAGDVFSLADISAFTIALACRKQLDWTGLPRLERWFAEVEGREAVRRGMRAFDVPIAV